MGMYNSACRSRWIFSSTTTITIVAALLLLILTFGEGSSSFPEYSSSSSSSSSNPSGAAVVAQTPSQPQQQPRYSYHPHFHRCYVCLPDDKSSTIAKEIIATFPGQNISDCSYFDSQTNVNLNPHLQFIFSCPLNHSGCLLRTHGSSVSRTCAHFPINDCKVANSIELCYCTGSLCNKDRTKFSTIPLSLANSELISNKYKNNNNVNNNNDGLFEEGETDDEDLLGPLSLGTSGQGPPPDQSSSSSGSDSSIERNNINPENIPTNRIDDKAKSLANSLFSSSSFFILMNFLLFQMYLFR